MLVYQQSQPVKLKYVYPLYPLGMSLLSVHPFPKFSTHLILTSHYPVKFDISVFGRSGHNFSDRGFRAAFNLCPNVFVDFAKKSTQPE